MLFLPTAFLLLGSGPASEHYPRETFTAFRMPFFAEDGALAVTSYDVVVYVPTPGTVYELPMPPGFRADPSTYVVALSRVIWLRNGDSFAYASLERARGTPGRVDVGWQLATLPAPLGDTDAITGEGEAVLWVAKNREELWRLTANTSLDGKTGVRVDTLRGQYDFGPPVGAHRSKVVFRSGGCDVVTEPATVGQAATVRRLDSFTGSPQGSLCDAVPLRERGRLWLQTKNALVGDAGDSWFVLRSSLGWSEPDPRMSYEPEASAWSWLRYPRRWFRRHGLPVAGGLLLGASLTAGAFVSNERAHTPGFARSLGAVILAQPLAATLNAASVADTGGRAGPAVQRGLIGLSVVLSPLPALGAWAGGRISDDQAAHRGRGFAAGYLGGIIGATLGTSLSALVLRDSDRARSWWFAQLASSALIGFGASLGYALAAGLPDHAGTP